MQKFFLILLVLVVIGAGVWYYQGGNILKAVKTTSMQEAMNTYAGKKVLFVDSYHAGYEWSDGVTRGVQKTLEGTGVELKVVRMDTKRNPSAEFLTQSAANTRAEIDAFKPDVLITSDDNAFKAVVMPFYKDAALPVVFCGLNWDASVYGAPYRNTTGMVEVSLTNQIIDQLSVFAKGARIGYLSADTETEHKNLDAYGKFLNITFTKAYFPKDFAEWKTDFKKMQNEVDMIIFENNAGIKDWNDNEAEAFAYSETKVPVGTTNPWIMKTALLGITKIPEEQGEWSAQSALQILGGEKPSDIPVVKNKLGTLSVNLKIADKLHASFAPSVLKNAQVIQ